jgi:dTDP-4-dehydrorhamnose reductase
MKVLILGGRGQLGRALQAAAPAGHELRVLSRAECDLADGASLTTAVRAEAADIVINAAGYTRVDEAESEAEEAERVNGTAPGIIASVARESGGRMVHVSTDFVFDGRKSQPYRPDDPPAPLGVYGRSKWHGEQAVAAADPDALIVRTAWVYDAQGTNFLATVLRLAREGDRVTIIDDQVGTPTAAASLAKGLWGLVGARARGTFHYTDAGVASWYDFAVAVAEEARALGLLEREACIEPIPSSQYPTAAARPAYSVLDKSETWAVLGWKAPHWRVSLRAVLREATERG